VTLRVQYETQVTADWPHSSDLPAASPPHQKPKLSAFSSQLLATTNQRGTEVMKLHPRNTFQFALALTALALNLSVIPPAQAAGWVATSPMATARADHTATLLPNGKVLVAGGLGSTAELYDVGLGFSASWQPQISSVTSPVISGGGTAALTGSKFRGISEGSGGTTQDSPADYPVVQLRRLDNEQTLFLLSQN
jgi:hypothetical protein